jgi:AcrR family transcriptional regulator
MAHAVAAKGYADTTIADIVREATVSRRTFYEHFQTKADCLVALYDAASREALKVLQGAIDPAHSWQGQLEGAMRAYLGCLALNPVLLRTLFIDIIALGAPGLAARRRVSEEIAAFIVQVAERPSSGVHGVFTPALAMAVVGGIHELVLQAIEQGRADLDDLVAPSCELVRAVALREG